MCKYVVKRDGRVEPFDAKKIKKQIEFVCRGTEVNPIEFEAKLNAYLPEKIKTSEIQEMLLQTAIKEISPDTPEWDIVAGRLSMWDTYGAVYKNTGIKFKNWMSMIEYLTDRGYYVPTILEKIKRFGITEDDINYGTWKNINMDHPDFNKITRQSLIEKERYLIKDINGVLEYPFVAHIANAVLLSSDKEDFFKKYYYLVNDIISLATPFKANLRRGGNTGSCYIGSSIDSLGSIIKTWQDIALTERRGGGVGWDISRVRPSESYSKNILKSNNIVSWSKILNDIVVAVNQAGVRKGALTVGMAWWHLDIQDFIEARVETKGDIREKTFDIFPQPVVDNYFMEKVRYDEYVYQFNHYYFKKLTGIDVCDLVGDELHKALELAERLCIEGKLTHYRKIKAKNLFSKFLWHWIEIGSLYITDKDNLNKSNYLLNDPDPERRLNTPMGNLCVESFSVVKPAYNWKTIGENGNIKTVETDGMYHSCNLISINLVKTMDMSEEEYADVLYHATDMLDVSIDLSDNPTLEARLGSEKLRNIGIGFLGLADVMAHKGLLYDTEEGRIYGMKEAERLTYYAYKASIKLAKKRGSYPWYKPENYDKLLGEDPEQLNEWSELTGNNFNWKELQHEIKEHGIRNFLLTSIAPNTSTSLVMGVMPNYLPAYNKFYYDTLAGMQVPILPKFIKDKYWFYKTRTQYKTEDIIKFTRYVQRFIDTGVSMELNLNPNLSTIDSIAEEIVDGFLSGELKAVYYNTTPMDKEKQECTDCAN